MKKLILFLLTATLLILPLSGCFADNNQNEETTPANTTENTTPENTEPDYNPGPDETTPEVTTPDNPPEVTTPDNPAIDVPNYERPQELDEIFTWLEEKEDENSKMVFFTLFEGVEQILKNNGTYDSYDVWIAAHFSVAINCDYSKAVNEDWYPKTSPTDIKALNEAFYNFYKDDFSDDAFNKSSLSSKYLSFVYYKSEDFLVDYTALEKLLDLPYVTSLEVVYYFPYPISAE